MRHRWVLQLTTGIVLVMALVTGADVPATVRSIAASPQDDGYQKIKVGKAEGAIVPAERAAEFVKALTGSDRKEYWTPAKEDVARLEEKLEFHLRKVSDKRSPALWSKLRDYKRQYAGIVEGGRRKIYANFFCNNAKITDWKMRPVAVEDGGDCFFQIKYDIEAGTFSDLYINGEA
jgi:hypothetical protein